MDFAQLCASLVTVIVGAGMVILNDHLRVRMERRIRRGDALMQLYVDLGIKLEIAVRERQKCHTGELNDWKNGRCPESPEDRERRSVADEQFSHCANQLRFFEPYSELTERIERLVCKFYQPIANVDDETPPEEYYAACAGYWQVASKLRDDAREILEIAREKHKRSLELV